MDLSEPTENVLWELQALRDACPGRWILIGRCDRIASLVQTGSHGDEVQRQLLGEIDGEEVLTYDTSNLAPFSAALAATAERLPIEERERSES